MTSLPDGWLVHEPLDPTADDAGIDLRVVPGSTSLSLLFWREGLEPWGKTFPLGPCRFVLPKYPTFDDVWALWMMAVRETRGPSAEIPAAWESVCVYADQIRQGFCPERIAAERTVQAVFRSLAERSLDPQAAGKPFPLDQALALCAQVARRVETGARILDDDLFGETPWLEPHLTLLQADRRLYREDVRRNRRYLATVPGDASKAARSLPLLALDRPLSRLFKMWARRDESAPGGSGYPLLLSRAPDGEIVLSADPALRLDIGFLAAPLARADRGAEWYDGARHRGTLIASPRAGTSLSFEAVTGILTRELRLRRVSDGGRSAPYAALGASTLAAAVAFAGWHLGASRTEPPRGAAGTAAVVAPAPAPSYARSMGNDPLPSDEKINLFDRSAGVTSFTPYAIVIGVCGYTGRYLGEGRGTEPLKHTCNDAWEFAHLLIRDYGYPPENVVLMIDDKRRVEHPEARPMPDAIRTPTLDNVLRVIENWQRDRGPRPAEKATLVFYYSGHGQTIQGLPYLALANWEDDLASGKPVAEAGLPMDRVYKLVDAGIRSKHALFLFDNCHAGWALSMGEDEHEQIQRRWAQSIKFGIAASQKDQEAGDNPDAPHYSIFTRYLIQGLSLEQGAAAADTDDGCGTDHVVTHAELLAYLQRHVPDAAKGELGKIQTPVGYRFDDVGDGQFLFVAPDAENWLARRKCAGR